MIKFFRTIRKNLINEGKTAKYFKYAIGEIVLVMIGILLALQVNNWNELRKERVKEKKILTELKRDLVLNDSILQQEIVIQQNHAYDITKTIEHLKKGKKFNDTISLYLTQISFIERIQFVSSAYESLKSIGIDIISSDPLRSDIASLFGNEFPFKTTWLRDAGLKHADLLFPYYVRFFESTLEPLQNEIENFQENPDRQILRLNPDYENLLQSQEFINVISKKRSFKMAIVSSLKQLQDQIRKTIKEIDKELETF